jgi:hypothetical protein
MKKQKVHKTFLLAFLHHPLYYGGLALVVMCTAMVYGTPNVSAIASPLSKNDVIQSTNEERRRAGLVPLQSNVMLERAATAKANDMMKNQYWNHTSPTGITPWKWITDQGYGYSHAGENLAKGFEVPNGVISAWMASPAHRVNMLSTDYRDIGVGVVNGNLLGTRTTLVVAMYAAPAQPLAAAAGSPSAKTGFGFGSLLGVDHLPVTVMALFGALLVVGVAWIFRGSIKTSRYQRGNAYKTIGLTMLSGIIIIMYSGGQI